MYLAEAYCHLGKPIDVIFVNKIIKIVKALGWLSSSSVHNSNAVFNTRNILGEKSALFSSVPSKVIYYTNSATVHTVKNNYQEA